MSTIISALKSFEQHLDDTPFTRTQRKVWILSAMGVLLDGFDFFIIGVALPLIAHDFHMDAATKGLVAVAAVAGAFLGALVFGQVADRAGRKGMFMVDIILFVVFSAASAAAWNPASLIVFRFFLGVGIGADYPIGVSYIAECVPTRLRGRLIVGAFAFQALGSLLGVLVGLLILKADPTLSAWRLMLAFGVLPAVVVVIMRDGLPESVRWHLARGNYEKASHAASALLEMPITLNAQNSPDVPSGTSFASLFKKSCIRRTIFASVAVVPARHLDLRHRYLHPNHYGGNGSGHYFQLHRQGYGGHRRRSRRRHAAGGGLYAGHRAGSLPEPGDAADRGVRGNGAGSADGGCIVVMHGGIC